MEEVVSTQKKGKILLVFPNVRPEMNAVSVVQVI